MILWTYLRCYENTDWKYHPMKKIVYMGLEFKVKDSKVCYIPLKDKCEAIRNLESPKTLKQTRAFCGMVNFLSSFLPNLWHLLIPIYNLQKKCKKFKWTQEVEKSFKEIKELLISPQVLRAPTPEGLFQLESDTSGEGVELLCFKSKETNGLLLVIIQKDCPLQQRISELLN